MLDPFLDDKSNLSGLIVHMHPGEDYLSCATRIATPGLAQQVYSKLKASRNHDVQEWAKSANGVNGISMGNVLEQCWHNQLGFGHGFKGCLIRELTDTNKINEMEKIDLTAFAGVTSFARRNMMDLTIADARENHYYLPPHNFPTIDSFTALRKPFCDPSNNNLCLVAFQMTVNLKEHPLKISGARLVRIKVKEMFKMAKALDLKNIYIVFVTTKEVAPSYKCKQVWTTKSDDESQGEFDAVRQFVMVMPEL